MFVFPEDCEPYLKDLVEEMQMEEIVNAAGPIPTNTGSGKQKKCLCQHRLNF
jgi:hypothetical protein